MSLFQDKKLEKQDGTTVDAMTVVNEAKAIAVYFSAHWCPPCRGFTPVLKEFYEKVGDDLCIIFVSSDGTDEDMKSYFKDAHGDYYCVPFKDEALRKTLKDQCQVSGIPKLCVIDKNGKMLYGNGRSDVTSKPPKEAFEEWQKLC